MELHLLVTANVSAVFEAVIHDFSEAEAMHYADTLDVFFSAGWKDYSAFNAEYILNIC